MEAKPQAAFDLWKRVIDTRNPSQKLVDLRNFLALYKVGTILKRPQKNVRPLRIALCGDVGAGKSSLIKSILTLCNDSNQTEIRPGQIGPSETHTLANSKYCIAPNDDGKLEVALIDTTGFSPETPNNYKISYLKDMANGRWEDEKHTPSPSSFFGWLFNYKPKDPDENYYYDVIIYVVRTPFEKALDKKIAFVRELRKKFGTKIIPVLNIGDQLDIIFREKWVIREGFLAIKCKLPDYWEEDEECLTEYFELIKSAMIAAEKIRFP